MARATGKDHARVNLDIWNDDAWLDLSPAAQHLYFVLWTSPGLSYCGAGEWRPGKIAQRAKGWTTRGVELAAAELSRELFLIIDEDAEEFLLRSWAKHDGLWRTPNMAVSLANARADLASRTLRGVVVFEVLKLSRSHPDSSSWKRDQVATLLSQKPIDPAGIEPFNPAPNPTNNPPPNPAANPSGQPIGPTLNGGVEVNPPRNPPATPAPAPTSCSISPEGYVTEEPHLRSGHDPNHPPPATCTQHRDGTAAPCRACADARRDRERWDAQQHLKGIEARRREREDQAAATAAEIAACDLCDEHGYVGTRVCDHDPDAVERNRRGADQVRAAMAAAKEARGA